VSPQELHAQLAALGVAILPQVPVPPRSFTWPAELPGLGARMLGAYTRCTTCEFGTWVRYGAEPRCWVCAGRAAAIAPAAMVASNHCPAIVEVDDHVESGVVHLAADIVSDETLAKVFTGDLAAAWRRYAKARALDEAVVQAGLEAIRKGAG
jgi:hypothetical protein